MCWECYQFLFFGFLPIIFNYKNILNLQPTINKFQNIDQMELMSEIGNRSEKPAPVVQQSQDKNDLKVKQAPVKSKIIRKKNKSKAKQSETAQLNSTAQVKAPNTMAPFGIFQSQAQKCQRLQHYLRKDIQNFYKIQIQPSQAEILDNILNYNLIQLSDVYSKDLNVIWKQKICSLSELKNYLQIISLSKNTNLKYSIVFDQVSKKYYALFTDEENSVKVYQVTQFQVNLLQRRENFKHLFRNSQQKFQRKSQMQPETKSHHKMSQLAFQIAFLFKCLYDSTKQLKNHIINLKHSIEYITKSQPKLQSPLTIQNNYITYLVKKLVLNSLKDDPIDYLNFFKNNQLVQHNNGPNQATLIDQKEFQQFMKKKKNKKGKKGKYVLHTACIGCCSSYYEQYNPFSYCQECYVRFHRSCYSGFPARQQFLYLNPRQQKDVLCQSCFNKKINPNSKPRFNQCDFCGLRGLLNVPAGQFKRIHIFCMLLNGLWMVKNNKIQFKSKTDNKVLNSDSTKCAHCNSGTGFLHSCKNCERYVHVSCAYFNGWRIQAQFNSQNENVQLKLYCCGGVPISQNEKRRKFITNYKKHAYSF